MRIFFAVIVGVVVYLVGKFALGLAMFQILLFLVGYPSLPLSWAAIIALSSEILAGLIALKTGFYIHRRISPRAA